MDCKKLVVIVVIILILSVAPVKAYSSAEMENNIDIPPIFDSIPKELTPYLPDSFLKSNDAVQAAESIDIGVIFKLLFNVLKKAGGSFVKKICAYTGLCLLISLINTTSNTLSNTFFTKTITSATLLGTAVFTYDLTKNIWVENEVFLKSINGFINASLPVMTLIYSFGGNLGSAALNSTVTAFILTFTNDMMYSYAYPLIKICFGLSIVSNFGCLEGLNTITKTVKNIFTAALTGGVTLFSVFLIFKTNIAASADIQYAFIFPETSRLGRLYPTAYQGIGIGAQSFFHHRMTGTPVLLYIFQGAQIADLASKVSVGYEWNLGASYGWKKNDVVSSRWNIYINVGIPVTWHIS